MCPAACFVFEEHGFDELADDGLLMGIEMLDCFEGVFELVAGAAFVFVLLHESGKISSFGQTQFGELGGRGGLTGFARPRAEPTPAGGRLVAS